jgi:hypothetical protein
MARIVIDIPDHRVAFFMELIKNLGIKKVYKLSDKEIKDRQTKVKEYKIDVDNIDETVLLSENSLAEDWLSDEDSRWDEVL